LRRLIATPLRADIADIRLPALISAAAVTVLAAPASASAFVHVVAPGESLSSVAAADGLSIEQLAAANGMSPESSLLAGNSLVIPSQESNATASSNGSEEAEPGLATDPDADGDPETVSSTQEGSASAGAPATSTDSYVVQPGDTLSAIAARAGMSTEALAAANGLEVNAPLLSGTALRLSAGPGEAAAGEGSAASATASSQPEGASAAGSESSPPYTTEETVTPSEVGTIAAENGVSPSLAEAVAAQESGFNNGLTSSADARGVMQILPGTWSWIGETLAPAPLAPASAASNVRAGVLLLRSLLQSTGGDPELAVAGYYQGLPSVRAEGELPETEQYVGEVLALRGQYGGE
jgi:N-acetylmuramoyl-L-alanine amidase